MLNIVPILLNFLLLPLPVDHETTPDAKHVEVTQISDADDLAIFSENFFDRPFSQLILKNHLSPADMAETGLIEGGIYFVYDKTGNTLGVLKAMPTAYDDDVALFEDEYSAIDGLSHLSFKNFHTVNLFGRAQGEINGEDMLVLAESVAPGQTINQLIKDYSKMSSSPGKEQAINDIEAGVDATAVALAELHLKSPKSQANSYYLKKYNGHLPGPYGIIHGDTHPGNIFYDKKNAQSTFIDFQLAPDLQVGGPVGYDIANFLVTTELMGKYKKIPDSDMERLCTSFVSTYRANGVTISDSDITYYKTKIYERYANIPDDWLEGPDAHQAAFISEYSKKKLEGMAS